jgi:hypothetical protein
MKITQSQLRRIIKEELETTLKEYDKDRVNTPYLQAMRMLLIPAREGKVGVTEISQRDARELRGNSVMIGTEKFKGALSDPAFEGSLEKIEKFLRELTPGVTYVSDQEYKQVQDLFASGNVAAAQELEDKLAKDPNMRGRFTRDPEGRSQDLIVMNALKGTRTANVLFIIFKTIGKYYALGDRKQPERGPSYYIAAVRSPGVAK